MDVPDDLLPDAVRSGQAHVAVLECIRDLGHTFGNLDAWDTYCTTAEMMGPDCPYTRVAAKTVLAETTLRTQLTDLYEALSVWLMR